MRPASIFIDAGLFACVLAPRFSSREEKCEAGSAGGAGSLTVGATGGVLTANKLTNYRIAQLEKKVEKHNQVIDRVYMLEEHAAVLDEKITVANHWINDLEDFHK